MRIAVFGSHSGNNKGDLAILHSIIRHVKERLPDSEFVVPTKDPAYLRRFDDRNHVEYVRSPTNYLGRRVLRPIREADVVVVGGGGLFFDRRKYDPTYNHVVNIFPLVKLCGLTGTPVYLFSVGSHPLDGFTSRLTAGILSAVDRITVRDELSRRIFGSLIDSEVRRFADPAFLLVGDRTPTVDRLVAEQDIAETDSLLVMVNGTVGKPEYRREFRRTLAELASSYRTFLLDTMTSQRLAAELAEDIPDCRPLVDANHLRGEEHIALISAFDRAVSVPMHGSIFAYLSDTPFVAVEYEPKVEEFNSIIENAHRTGLDSLDAIPRQVKGATRSGLRPKEEVRELAAANFEDFRDFVETRECS